jgi:hypothetical protein
MKNPLPEKLRKKQVSRKAAKLAKKSLFVFRSLTGGDQIGAATIRCECINEFLLGAQFGATVGE